MRTLCSKECLGKLARGFFFPYPACAKRRAYAWGWCQHPQTFCGGPPGYRPRVPPTVQDQRVRTENIPCISTLLNEVFFFYRRSLYFCVCGTRLGSRRLDPNAQCSIRSNVSNSYVVHLQQRHRTVAGVRGGLSIAVQFLLDVCAGFQNKCSRPFDPAIPPCTAILVGVCFERCRRPRCFKKTLHPFCARHSFFKVSRKKKKCLPNAAFHSLKMCVAERAQQANSCQTCELP